jgi:hypothetical protein
LRSGANPKESEGGVACAVHLTFSDASNKDNSMEDEKLYAL